MATKKVKISTMKNILKGVDVSTEEVEWNGMNIIVKSKVGLEDLMSAVKNIVDSCFTDEGDYFPETKDFIIRSIIIETFTNLSFPKDNINLMYDFMMNTNLFNVVLPKIDEEQYLTIIDAVDKKIEYKISSDIEVIRDEILEMYQGLEEFSQALSESFGDLNVEDFENARNALNDGSLFDEEKAMKAWLKENQLKEASREDLKSEDK